MVVLFASALTVAACAQDRDIAEESAISGAFEADRRLAACLAQAGHGSSLEDADLRRIEDERFNAAVETCADTLGIDVPAAGETTRMVAEMLAALVGCLAEHGWEPARPDPGPDGSLRIDDIAESVPPAQRASFEADVEICREAATSPG